MGAPYIRPRVYVQFRHRGTVIRRVLDIAFVHGADPVAVVTWVKVDGAMQPDDYVYLDERRLHRAAPAGMFSYEPVIDDPRFAPPAPVASAHAGEEGAREKEEA